MKRRLPLPTRVVRLVLSVVLILVGDVALAAVSPHAAAGKPTPAEAVAAAFGPSTKLDAKGNFPWTVPPNQPGPWRDLSGEVVPDSVKYFKALPTADGKPRWLLVTGEVKCHGCGAPVSAFVLARGSNGELVREAAAPVLTWASNWSDASEVSVVAIGPARWALRLENRSTDQGETGISQTFYALAPGFPELLDLPVHYDLDGTCTRGPRERARERALNGYESTVCSTTNTTLRFVPARPGETDDPGQWVVRATTRGDIEHEMLPLGVIRLPFRGGRYRLPTRAPRR